MRQPGGNHQAQRSDPDEEEKGHETMQWRPLFKRASFPQFQIEVNHFSLATRPAGGAEMDPHEATDPSR